MVAVNILSDVIPVTIVGMVIFVISDVARRIIDRRRKGAPRG
jgi:hypothetical protein